MTFPYEQFALDSNKAIIIHTHLTLAYIQIYLKIPRRWLKSSTS